jgi:hypothetical protein
MPIGARATEPGYRVRSASSMIVAMSDRTGRQPRVAIASLGSAMSLGESPGRRGAMLYGIRRRSATLPCSITSRTE